VVQNAISKESFIEALSIDHSKVYAYGGETAECENGHPIFTFPYTVYKAQPKYPNDWTWHQKQPDMGTLQPTCERCGSKWYNDYKFRINGKFR